MERDVYLEHYRLSKADGTTVKIGQNGPAVTYKASDLRSGAPVALTLVPISSVDPDERERFEEKARTAMLLDHAHIAKTVAFDTVDDQFVFVSEFPQGETAEAWVTAHGPMPADAVLRIALQVISALGAASFHGLTHPAIQPANLIIVRGKTFESGWPLIKLTHFALAGLKSAPGETQPDLNASDFASPEQLLTGQVDFRSEIFSLGATMCFLLTGVLYSAYPRWPQTKRFVRPLRTLVARTLQDEPAERPQDPILFAGEVRNCLTKVERRQAWERRLGMPLLGVVKKERRRVIVREPARPRGLRTVLASVSPPADDLPFAERSLLWSRRGWVIAGAAALLVVGIVSALLLPEDVVTAALHRQKSIKTIGVPVGVPEASPPAIAQASPNISSQPQIASAPATPVVAQGPAAADVKPTAAPAATLQALDEDNQAFLGSLAAAKTKAGVMASRSPVEPSSSPGSPNNQAPTLAANTTTPPPQPPAEQPSAEARPPNESNMQAEAAAPVQPSDRESIESDSQRHPGESISGRDASAATAASKSHAQSSADGQNRIHSSKPRVVRKSHDYSPRYRRVGTFQARVVGVTPNGNVIVVLPSGERAIVSPRDTDPDEPVAPVHGPVRRAIIPRSTPVPQPGPPVPPYQPFLAAPDDG